MQGNECYGRRLPETREIPLLLPFLAIIGIVATVHDGDTFRLADGTRVRLQGIDANELNGTCHVRCAPLPAASSRDNLAALILGREVACQPTGKSYKRVVARCSIKGVDLSCYQIRSGAAVRWAKYDKENRLAACNPGRSRSSGLVSP